MRKKLKWIIPIAVIALLAAAFFIYTGNYYHVDETGLAALVADDTVQVSRTDYGWYFDGPSSDSGLIFYPGAKVEATAYAPMLHQLAQAGMDVCLVEMPFRLAVFRINEAEMVMEEQSYDHWYIGGHSLGGAMAANYAAENGKKLAGVILFAAYPTKPLDAQLTEISIYGSEDKVLNRKKVEAGKAYAPQNFFEDIIEGGNHAQFGNYGPQKGDGEAHISSKEQQQQAVDFIVKSLKL